MNEASPVAKTRDASVPERTLDMTSIAPAVIYVSCPMHIYNQPRYGRLVAAIRERWPEAVILEPKHLYTSNGEWLARWPSTLATLDTLVYFGDARGFYLSGVRKEVEDARRNRIPLWFLDEAGTFHPDGDTRHDLICRGLPGRAWRVSLRTTPPVARGARIAIGG